VQTALLIFDPDGMRTGVGLAWRSGNGVAQRAFTYMTGESGREDSSRTVVWIAGLGYGR
jgi:hypothetical protein